ncbi:PAS domain-containing sensor histidine kinase [Cohaesibacter gelatinilyticus]|uniref:histidine kinase n=1 Tax=Cohaesibacter gelatinilyticus TaxID=372072 RepID=A0A285NDR8_9HYPH|nr:PAS domain-containing sensor histidine kinase [Cohaesibacter gelatinilyticus]SNZ07097.1 multi-sensor signal transduction histidine kinase [Cohaesibacter gelatinilyticus]
MLKGASYIAPFRSVVDGLVHPAMREQGEIADNHRIFMTVHLLIGGLALAALPVFLLLAPATHIVEAVAPVWFLAPFLPVALLSRQGNLSHALIFSALLAASFVCWMAILTGGLKSYHLIWLIVIPMESALAGYRSSQGKTFAIAALAFLSVAVTSMSGQISHWQASDSFASTLTYLSGMAALLYAATLILRIDALQRGRLRSARQGEMRYRKIADTVTDMITRHNSNGDVTFASCGALALLRLGSDKLEGNGLFQRIHIPDRPAYLQAISEVLYKSDDDHEPVTVELRMMRSMSDISDSQEMLSDKALIWTEMKCAPERDASGEIVGVVAATRDISVRKERQEELIEARNEAEAANLSKTRFLANVTHELRTPLNTIIGFSELLLNPLVVQDQQERQHEYAELINKGGNHLLSLVNALLDMSRIESGNFEVHPHQFDMKELVEDCCKMMQTDAEKKSVALYANIDDKVPDVNMDPRACRQILLNLMSNAIKFSDEQGQVAVSIGWDRDEDSNILSDHIRLIVNDKGIGIDADDIPRLATPFVQADSSHQRRYEGAGIGLSIVKGLAELQGGSLTIESELGAGTSMIIRLPIDMEKQLPAKEVEESVVALKAIAQGEVTPQTRQPRVAITRHKDGKCKSYVA